jgi:uncharacterized membrane protein
VFTAHAFDLTPNCSLSLRGARLFLASVCIPTFGVAGAATLMGYWPVLPFAGAEILLLVWALKSNMARRFEHEHIEVSENEVSIEYSHDLAPALRRRIVFPRHWARVKIRRPNSLRSSLVIESHGRSHEVGRFLTEEERRHLAAQLQLLIGGTNQSPALPRPGSPDQFS